jgi:bifunctional non-homologous end joining protein LigD
LAPRVLFPEAGFSTDDLVDAYRRLAPVLLPHLRDRPLTLKRFPDDIHGEAFWEKDAPSFTPAEVKRLPVPRKRESGVIQYISLQNAKSLAWAASVGCVEIHSLLHRYPYIESPTLMAFDLDPGSGMDVVDCCAVALEIEKWFSGYGLATFPKVSGSKGIQVYVPLNTPSSYAITQPVARHVAEQVEQQHPNDVISQMARTDRRGKVFIDWSQNAEYKTTVSVYSVRAKHEHPYVSVPISWKEVRKALAKRKRELLIFPPDVAIARIEEQGDLFSPVLTMEQSLPGSLVRELRLPAAPRSKPVLVRAARLDPDALPRSSKQGGRKLFVIHKRGSKLELGIERNERFALFQVAKFPTARRKVTAHPIPSDRPLAYLTNESSDAGMVWDLGTYEIVEGSYAKGYVDVYFSGRRLEGRWALLRHGDDWELENKGGRLNIKTDESALAKLRGPVRTKPVGQSIQSG